MFPLVHILTAQDSSNITIVPIICAIEYSPKNSEYCGDFWLKLILEWLKDKYGQRLTKPLWKDESNYLQWNGDPFMAGCGAKNFESPCGSGKREFPGTVFTLPYWMAKYHDLIPDE